MCHLCTVPPFRMANSSSVPSVPVRVDEKNIQNGAKDILKLVRPNWSAQNLRFKVFTEGLSNKLVGFFVDTNPEDMVIIKVFGTNTDFMIDRKAEIETMRVS
jgi:ethanolamine kinase